MPTSYTSLLGLALPVTGELSGTWGDTVNNYITQYVDAAVEGTQTISGSQTAVTLTVTNGTSLSQAGTGATGSAQYAIINCTGNPASTLTITAPASSRKYIVINATSTSQSVQVVGAGPTTGVTIAAGQKAIVAWNGSDFVQVSGGGGLSYVAKSTTYTAQNNEGVLTNTSGGAFTVTLPASPTVGAQVVVADSGGTWGTNNLTVGRNGSTIAGLAENLVCDINGASVQLVYDGTTWDVFAQVGGNGGNVATQPGNNAFTGANTFYNSSGQVFGTGTSTQDGITLAGRAGGSSSYRVTLTPATLSSSTTLTLPNVTSTVAVLGTAQTFTGTQTVLAAATQDAIALAGRAGGTSSYVMTLTPTTLSASRTVTFPNETFTVGFRNLPAVGTQTGSYTLGVNDVGKYVQISTGGSIVIPTSTFAEGDAVTLYNNTTGNITITCSAPTAYIAGTNTVKTSMTLATRGVATVFFYSATTCVVTGNVT